MKLGLGADQHGYALKEAIKPYVEGLGHQVHDYGVASADPVDYPDVAETVARAVAAGAIDRAILVCGTGLGMAIAANKIPGVRAGSVTDPYSAERLVRSNNAQVLCLGGRVVGVEVAKILIDHFMSSTFQGGESARKVAKLEALERDGSSGATRLTSRSGLAASQPAGSTVTEEEIHDPA
jgi:ribose 5-phosphate isomerase B